MKIIRIILGLIWLGMVAGLGAETTRPNFIFLYADNLGYGDVGFLGSKKHRTPQLDRMAKEGMTFRHLYSASGVCTPSRAALMTGCYPQRIGLANPKPDGLVLRPVSPNGLNPDEVTIAEKLKRAGYATTCIGKWHLGDQPPFLPTKQGFDSYFGVPYSEDMVGNKGRGWPPLPLMKNEEVIEAPVDRSQLTKRYTALAVEFIKMNRTQPFFLYLPHAVPGSVSKPFASEAFAGKSKNGSYGDSVEELDWSTGVILQALRELGLAERTLVIFTSDNGTPHRGGLAGSNLPLGGWGYTTAEGGMRVPAVAWWPGTIKPGTTCDGLMTMMDWLPTFASLAQVEPATDRVIDGKDISRLLRDPESASPHEVFYYYQMEQLQAVRSGKWKLYVAIEGPMRRPGIHSKARKAKLFDVVQDMAEKKDLAASRPEVVRRLEKWAEAARVELGDTNRKGEGWRPVGRFQVPKPRILAKKKPVQFK